MKTKAKDMVGWFVWVPVRSMLYRLPIKFSYLLADLVSRLAFHLWLPMRRMAAEELALLYGSSIHGKRREEIIRLSLRVFFLRQVENLLFDRFDRKLLSENVSIEGIENVRASTSGGKGTIILLCHFGSFLMPLPLLAYKGYKVHQLAGNPLIGNSMSRKIFEIRKSISDRMPFDFFLSGSYLGPVVRALRKNEIVVVAFDGRTGSNWIRIPILSRTAVLSPGSFDLASRTGAQIVPTFVVRDHGYKLRVIFEPPMKLKSKGGKEEMLAADCAQYVAIFEKYLTRYPCHFLPTLCSIRKEAEAGLNSPLFVDQQTRTS